MNAKPINNERENRKQVPRFYPEGSHVVYPSAFEPTCANLLLIRSHLIFKTRFLAKINAKPGSRCRGSTPRRRMSRTPQRLNWRARVCCSSVPISSLKPVFGPKHAGRWILVRGRAIAPEALQGPINNKRDTRKQAPRFYPEGPETPNPKPQTRIPDP